MPFKNPVTRIVGFNLVLVLALSALATLASRLQLDGAIWLYGPAVFLQFATNGLIALRRMDTGGAGPYFLSALLVLMIGFGTCATF